MPAALAIFVALLFLSFVFIAVACGLTWRSPPRANNANPALASFLVPQGPDAAF